MPKQWTCENDVLKSFGSHIYVIIHIYPVDWICTEHVLQCHWYKKKKTDKNVLLRGFLFGITLLWPFRTGATVQDSDLMLPHLSTNTHLTFPQTLYLLRLAESRLNMFGCPQQPCQTCLLIHFCHSFVLLGYCISAEHAKIYTLSLYCRLILFLHGKLLITVISVNHSLILNCNFTINWQNHVH